MTETFFPRAGPQRPDTRDDVKLLLELLLRIEGRVQSVERRLAEAETRILELEMRP